MDQLLNFIAPEYRWIALPALILIAEMFVVTVGTVRIIFVSRGYRVSAAALGFCEVMTWLFAISQVMQNLTSIGCYLAFGLGFAFGNLLGIWIEEKLAIGTIVVRIITKPEAGTLVANLKAANYGVTCVDGNGATGPVQIVFTVVKRKDLANVREIIHRFNPKAFYSIEDLRSAAAGVFPLTRTETRIAA